MRILQDKKLVRTMQGGRIRIDEILISRIYRNRSGIHLRHFFFIRAHRFLIAHPAVVTAEEAAVKVTVGVVGNRSGPITMLVFTAKGTIARMSVLVVMPKPAGNHASRLVAVNPAALSTAPGSRSPSPSKAMPKSALWRFTSVTTPSGWVEPHR